MHNTSTRFIPKDRVTPCGSHVDLRAEPATASIAVNQCLYGETLIVNEARGAWLQVQTLRDHYPGFVESVSMRHIDTEATHWVSARSTLLFSEPDIKSPVVLSLPFGAKLALTDVSEGSLTQTRCHRYVRPEHCLAQGETFDGPPVDHIESRFIGTPYRWGGRSPSGVDCSGFIQMMAYAGGLMLPRDSGDQQRQLQQTVDAAARRRGDLVFWPGHVAVLLDPDTVFHANAHSLDCRQEPLADVIARAGQPTAFKRLP